LQVEAKIVGTDNGAIPTPPMTETTYKDGVVVFDIGVLATLAESMKLNFMDSNGFLEYKRATNALSWFFCVHMSAVMIIFYLVLIIGIMLYTFPFLCKGE